MAFIGISASTVWRHTFGRIRRVEKFIETEAVKRDEFDRHIQEQETIRRETREDLIRVRDGIGKVYERMDTVVTRQEQIRTELLDAIHSVEERRRKPRE